MHHWRVSRHWSSLRRWRVVRRWTVFEIPCPKHDTRPPRGLCTMEQAAGRRHRDSSDTHPKRPERNNTLPSRVLDADVEAIACGPATYTRSMRQSPTRVCACEHNVPRASVVQRVRVGEWKFEELSELLLDEIRQAVDGFGERGKVPARGRLHAEVPLPACF